LRQLEDILRFTRLDVDLGQESLDHIDNFWYIRLVGTVIRSIFQHSLQEQRISTETGGGFGEITVQFQFTRFRFTLRFLEQVSAVMGQMEGGRVGKHMLCFPTPVVTYINKFLKGSICTFLFLKFVFPKQLMCTIRHERFKMNSTFKEEITDSLNDGLLFLAFRQSFR